MALKSLKLSPEHTPPSSISGAILLSEKTATQKLLKTCGPQLRTTLTPILLDLISYNRITPPVMRHLSILSQSLLTYQAFPGIQCHLKQGTVRVNVKGLHAFCGLRQD